jgi:hypothetical protein
MRKTKACSFGIKILSVCVEAASYPAVGVCRAAVLNHCAAAHLHATVPRVFELKNGIIKLNKEIQKMRHSFQCQLLCVIMYVLMSS